MDAAFDLGYALGCGESASELTVPAALADALRFDLRVSLAEYVAMPDLGWYLELVELRDAFREGQRLAKEASEQMARATAHLHERRG